MFKFNFITSSDEDNTTEEPTSKHEILPDRDNICMITSLARLGIFKLL